MGHRTSEVYDFCRLHRGRIIPLQGVDTRRMTQPHTWSIIEYYPGTKKPIPGGIKLLRADVNFYKDDLAGKLEVNPEDPGAWHLHAEATEELARHMCAEVTDEKGLWVPRANRPNHFWDCAVYNLVAWDVLGVRYMRPKRPKKADAGEQHRRDEGAGRAERGTRPGWLNKRPGWLKK